MIAGWSSISFAAATAAAAAAAADAAPMLHGQRSVQFVVSEHRRAWQA